MNHGLALPAPEVATLAPIPKVPELWLRTQGLLLTQECLWQEEEPSKPQSPLKGVAGLPLALPVFQILLGLDALTSFPGRDVYSELGKLPLSTVQSCNSVCSGFKIICQS